MVQGIRPRLTRGDWYMGPNSGEDSRGTMLQSYVLRDRYSVKCNGTIPSGPQIMSNIKFLHDAEVGSSAGNHHLPFGGMPRRAAKRQIVEVVAVAP